MRNLRIRKAILAVFGLVATTVGWGMWKEPYLDFNALVSLIAHEMLRLANDPFAVLGLMVMFFGLWALFKAFFEEDNEREIASDKGPDQLYPV